MSHIVMSHILMSHILMSHILMSHIVIRIRNDLGYPKVMLDTGGLD